MNKNLYAANSILLFSLGMGITMIAVMVIGSAAKFTMFALVQPESFFTNKVLYLFILYYTMMYVLIRYVLFFAVNELYKSGTIMYNKWKEKKNVSQDQD